MREICVNFMQKKCDRSVIIIGLEKRRSHENGLQMVNRVLEESFVVPWKLVVKRNHKES